LLAVLYSFKEVAFSEFCSLGQSIKVKDCMVAEICKVASSTMQKSAGYFKSIAIILIFMV
jgi:hypothetical protein